MYHYNYAATGAMAKHYTAKKNNNIMINHFNNYGACGDQGGNAIITIYSNGGNNVEHDARLLPPHNQGQGNRGQ